MAVKLSKGQGVSLKKSENDLSLVTIGLGWDVAEPKKGFLGKLFAGKAPDFDLDVVAFLCGSDGKLHDMGERKNGSPTLVNGDIVFYNSLQHKSGAVWLTGDNRTGEGEGDDEQVIIKLDSVPEKYAKIVFIVQIYDGAKLNQSFGEVKNAFIRAVDKNNKEMVRFDLSGGAQYADCRSILFAELTRDKGEWTFNAIGTPSQSDTFVDYLNQYR